MGALQSTGVNVAATAATFVPVVGPVLGPLVKLFGGLFGGAHAKNVANEAAALNFAVPASEQAFQGIVQLDNSGQITNAEADTALDTVLTSFDDAVYNQFKVKNNGSNGPALLHNELSGQATQIKGLLDAGTPGSVTIPAIPDSGRGFHGAPAYTVSYVPQTAAASLSSAIGATGATGTTGTSWLTWAIIAVVAILLLKSIL